MRRTTLLAWLRCSTMTSLTKPITISIFLLVQIEVGILRPNWLDGAKYLGQHRVDGFLCNVWENVDFIWYYEDVVTKKPIHWEFNIGRNAHVMMFEVGAVLKDAR
ncbi:hypothetical protein F2P56_032582 [Juglans regia]|uniref:Uncharacterized protein n=1 Tax=Juglans regia TaxID=51240 RepID=A0A833WV31_JUGRE|nr:hypothetical protein F2P56_032582 [Juglans regia]